MVSRIEILTRREIEQICKDKVDKEITLVYKDIEKLRLNVIALDDFIRLNFNKDKNGK